MTNTRGFEPIRFSLTRRLNQMGLGSAAEGAWVCAVAETVAVGRFTASRYRDGTLTLKAANPLVGHELRLQVAALEVMIRERLVWPAERTLRIRIVA